jgi:organic radical activating enzyme
MTTNESSIRVVSLSQGICGEGALYGQTAARLRVGPAGQARMTAPEIFSEIRSQSMPFHIALSGEPTVEPLDSLIKQAQDLGYKLSCVSSGADPVDWFANLDALVLMPPSPSSGETLDYDRLHLTLQRAYSGERFTDASIHLTIHDEDDYAFAQGVAQLHPSVPLWLAASSDDGAVMGRFSWLSQRVITDHWNEVFVVPHLPMPT